MNRRLTDEQRELVQANMPFAQWVANEYARRARCKFEWDDILSASYLGLCLAALKFDAELGFKFTTFAQYYCRCQIRHVLYCRPLIHRPRNKAEIPVCELTADLEPGFDPRETWESKQDLAALEVALAKLPADQRFVLICRRQGMTLREIGELLALNKQHVNRLEAAALARVRAYLVTQGVIEGDACSGFSIANKKTRRRPLSARPIRLLPSRSAKRDCQPA